MGSEKPFGFLTFSTLLHSGAAIALLMASNLTPLPMGSDPATIEFEAAPPQGVQMQEAAPSKAEVPVAPAPAPQPAPQLKKTKAVAVEKKAAEKKAEPKIATVLPEKETVEKVEEPEIQKEDMVAVAEPLEKIEEETKAPVEEEMLSEVEALETEAASAEAEPLVAAAAESTESEELEEVLEEDSVEEEWASAETAAEEALEQESIETEPAPAPPAPKAQPAAQAAGQFGSPQGLRSYEDLRQVPGNVAPKYPSDARLRRQQGQVVLKYFVTSDGRVANMQMVQSSGYASLDREAVQSISQFRYRPGQQGWTVHPVNFSLKGPEQRVGGRLRTSMNR